jgi:carbon storage regulator
MLVLSRKVGERILIGDQIAITVVRINATTVRLGIDAPSKLIVVREELAEGDKESERRTAPSTAG